MDHRPVFIKIALLITLTLVLGAPTLAWTRDNNDSGSRQEGEGGQQNGQGDDHERSSSSRPSGTENILADMSREVAAKVFDKMRGEGQYAMSARVAVVSAVPLSDLKRETEFGRVVAEYYLTDLADRGIQVKELRLGRDINIMPQTGEFILTQNSGELANDSPALDYVVVSTFSNTRKTLILQGRLLSLATGVVKTSWRYNIPLNREVMALLGANPKPFTIAVKGIGESDQPE
jgi:hypothetical protein